MEVWPKYKFSFSFIAVVFLAIGVIITFYGPIAVNPNSHFLKVSEDGLKNYFTFSYYINYNQSNFNFEGMNYPYGESILYTDGHPLLSFLLKHLSFVFPQVANYSVGILNSLLLSSLLISSVFLFLLFYEMKINTVLAVLSSVAIMMLSPQLFRFGGHYALAYSCFIPINLYLLWRFEKGGSIPLLTLLLVINSLFWFFTHAYLGMILVTFNSVYLVIKWIYEYKEQKKTYRSYIGLLTSIIIPTSGFILFLKLSDIHIGRTTNAGDLLDHSVIFFSVFFPFKGHPLFPFFESLFNKPSVHWEDIAYIGLAGDLVLIGLLFVLIRKYLGSKKTRIAKPVIEDPFLKIAIPASIVLLFFAMDYPFLFGMESLLEIKPFEIIKNFRANGRFAWVFYFVFSISAVYIINKLQVYLLVRKHKLIAATIILLYPLSIAFEGHYYHKYISSIINVNPNLFDIEQVDKNLQEAINSIDKNKYQSIIPLPYFHSGSGNFRRDSKEKIFQYTLLTSFHSRTPVMASRLSRVSIKESKNLVQLMSEGFYEKAVERDLVDDRPFLVIISNEKLTKNEKEFVKKCKFFYENNELKFYEIEKSVLFNTDAEAEQKRFNEKKSDFYARNDFLVSDSSSYFIYYDFEASKSKYSFRGEGAFSGSKNDTLVLLTLNGKDMEINTSYIVSVWVYNCGLNFGQDQLRGKLKLQSMNDPLIKSPTFSPRYSQTIYGCWSLVEFPFRLKNNEGKYRLLFFSDLNSDKTFYADDLLIYKKGVEIYRKDKQGKLTFLFKNNHKIPLDY